MSWQSIDTAPRDGRPIIATDLRQIRKAKFTYYSYLNGEPIGGMSWGRNDYGDPGFDPKYWMEIPPLEGSNFE
jgi:hypothetical protein